jgi:hypothetical protein
MGFSHGRVIFRFYSHGRVTVYCILRLFPREGYIYFDFIPTGGSRFLASNKLYVFEGTRIECGSLWRRTAPYGVTHLFNYRRLGVYKSIAIFSGILEHDKNARRFKKMSMEEYLPLDMAWRPYPADPPVGKTRSKIQPGTVYRESSVFECRTQPPSQGNFQQGTPPPDPPPRPRDITKPGSIVV